MDQEESVCKIKDTVHAYISVVNVDLRGTIMLVCTHKLRCICFDSINEFSEWDDVLKKNLRCTYFHADLILTSKESNLYNYARQRKRDSVNSLIPLLRSSNQNTATTSATIAEKLRGLTMSNASGDGYLHVTCDRMCFTTGPTGCSTDPRLLATWTFDNDEIVQCGTARVNHRPEDSNVDQVSLFFLTAFPSHPEAPGSHLFVCDRASELCEWIEKYNGTAIYQAEWCRLTSLTSSLMNSSSQRSDVPCANSTSRSVLMNGDASATVADTSTDSKIPILHLHSACNLPLPSPIHRCDDYFLQSSSCCIDCSSDACSCYTNEPMMTGITNRGASCGCLTDGLERKVLPTSPDLATFVQTNVDVIRAKSDDSTSASPKRQTIITEDLPPTDAMESVPSSENISLTPAIAPFGGKLPLTTAAAASSSSLICKPRTTSSKVAWSDMDNAAGQEQAAFETFKLSRIHSRRRFSSHPAEVFGRPTNPTCSQYTGSGPFNVCSSSLSMNKPRCLHGSCSHVHLNSGCQRRSDPQLVTIPPLPLALSELQEFLRHSRQTDRTCIANPDPLVTNPSYCRAISAPCGPYALDPAITNTSTHPASLCIHRQALLNGTNNLLQALEQNVEDNDFMHDGDMDSCSNERSSHVARTRLSSEGSTATSATDDCSATFSDRYSPCRIPQSNTVDLPEGGNYQPVEILDATARSSPIQIHPPMTRASGACRRHRLPSSWSNTSTGLTNAPGRFALENKSVDMYPTGSPSVDGNVFCCVRPPLLNRSLSSGNSPQFPVTPLLPTSTVIPGVQCLRRYHTTSMNDALLSKSGFTSSQFCPVTPGSSNPLTSAMHLTYPCRGPVWAGAPVKAKPRTGIFYVSREQLNIRKHQEHPQHQQYRPQQSNSPPSSGYLPHCPTFSAEPMTFTKPPALFNPISVLSAGFSSGYVCPHPCTPVPEASGETDEICDVSSEKLKRNHNFHRNGFVSDTMPLSNVESSLNGSHVLNVTGRPVVRSYVNVDLTHVRSGLFPIDEYHHNAPGGATTQPTLRRNLPPTRDQISSGLSQGMTPTASCNFAIDDSGRNCSTNTLGSYVNLSAELSFHPANRSGHILSSPITRIVGSTSVAPTTTVPPQYVNLTASFPHQHVRRLMAMTAGSNAPQMILGAVPHPHSNGISIESPQPLNVTVGSDPLLSRLNETTQPKVKSLLPPATSVHAGNTPRLHYARLDLSSVGLRNTPATNANQSSSIGTNSIVVCHSASSSTISTSGASTSISTSSSQTCLDSSNNSTVLAFNHSIPTTLHQYGAEDSAVLTKQCTNNCSGLNYVTIDSRQTKALSEIEQELRTGAAPLSVDPSASFQHLQLGSGQNVKRKSVTALWHHQGPSQPIDQQRHTSFNASKVLTRLTSGFLFPRRSRSTPLHSGRNV